jgi:hypothetical protein
VGIEARGSNAGGGMSRLSAGDLNVRARFSATEPAEGTIPDVSGSG